MLYPHDYFNRARDPIIGCLHGILASEGGYSIILESNSYGILGFSLIVYSHKERERAGEVKIDVIAIENSSKFSIRLSDIRVSDEECCTVDSEDFGDIQAKIRNIVLPEVQDIFEERAAKSIVRTPEERKLIKMVVSALY